LVDIFPLYEDDSLLSCDVMQFGRQVPTYWRNVLPSFSYPDGGRNRFVWSVGTYCQTTRCHCNFKVTAVMEATKLWVYYWRWRHFLFSIFLFCPNHFDISELHFFNLTFVIHCRIVFGILTHVGYKQWKAKLIYICIWQIAGPSGHMM